MIERVLHGVGVTLVALGVGTGAAALARWGLPAMAPLERYRRALARDLDFLQRAGRARWWVRAQLAAAACVLVASLAAGQPLLLPLLVPVAAVPRLWLSSQRTERVLQLEEQLAGWLTTLASALSAAGSLGEALASTVALSPSPMADEIDRTVKEYRLGTPLDAALDAMAERAGSRSVEGALLALRVARNHGGDLPATLRTAAATLREMTRLEAVVRTKTAEGKAQALVVSLIPAPLVGVIHWLSPGYLDPLFLSATGYMILGAAGAVWLAAIALAAKIVQVEV